MFGSDDERMMELHPISSKPLMDNQEAEGEDGDNDVESRLYRTDSMDDFHAQTHRLVGGFRAIQDTLVDNLDMFFRELYEYYEKKGFGSVIATYLMNLLSILFLISTTTFLLTGLKWGKLNECRLDQSTCEHFSDYIQAPFSSNATTSFLLSSLVLVSFSFSFLFWLLLLFSFPSVVRNAFKLRSIYRENGISTRDLQTMKWSRIVTKLREYNQKVVYVRNDMKVNALTVALRVLRIENYKIGFFCLNVLPLGSPSWESSFPYFFSRSSSSLKQKKLSNHWWMGQILELNLDLALFNDIIDKKTFQLRKNLTAVALSRYFRFLGLINLVLLPITLTITFVYFFFRYAEEFHSKRNYLGPRWWTPHSLWILREFNELPHLFTRRINKSLKVSEQYLKMFPVPVPIVLSRGIAFILGGLASVLLVLYIVDDSVLVRVTLSDRSLLWYFTILSSALAGLRGFIPTPEEEPRENPNVKMREIASCTHLLPDSWRGKAHTYDVKEEFENLFMYRAALLLRELICVICTPYILAVVFPKYSDKIIQFFRENTTNVPGVGDVCTFSLMNLEKDGDPKWKLFLKGIPLSNNSQLGPKKPIGPLLESKLEKSWLMFKIQYSADNCGIQDAVGEELLRRVRDLQSAKTSAMAGSNNSSSLVQPPPSRLYADDENFLMSASLSTLDPFQLIPPEIEEYEENYRVGVGEDVFWFFERFRDEEMRKRIVI